MLNIAGRVLGIKEWSHDTDIVTTWFSTGYWQTYDDHIAVARFTPRGPELTDVEIFWLVHPDAVARELNERPRKTLQFYSPAEKFNECVASTG